MRASDSLPPRRIGFIINPRKSGAVTDSIQACRYLEDRGIPVNYPTHGLDPELPHAPIDEHCLAGSEMLVVFGGDGTLLAASRYAAPRGIPMLSIRYGGFGFLAEAEPQELEAALDRVLRGEYTLDSRMMLATELVREDEVIHRTIALNDVVVTRGALSRVVRVRTEVDGGYVATYNADGVIVSTPTGSTAYSLSAGGPLVHPSVPVMLITPVCPHSLNARSIALADTGRVSLQLESIDEAMVTADGQVGCPVETGDIIHVFRSDTKADLVSFDATSFYERLQKRLHWADRFGDAHDRPSHP